MAERENAEQVILGVRWPDGGLINAVNSRTVPMIVAALREARLLPNRREQRERGVLAADGVIEVDFHPAAKEREYACWVYDPSPWVPVSEESQNASE